ncbi:hypothetical protein Ciccas_006933 [Cichlidogyrus casuarinus]|uniref:Uncharacterized protein n=1 Tax=Cichlidogyrus casuarinus TaxID=1844966 RepID=A0ABD2Q4B9_9PLAT
MLKCLSLFALLCVVFSATIPNDEQVECALFHKQLSFAECLGKTSSAVEKMIELLTCTKTQMTHLVNCFDCKLPEEMNRQDLVNYILVDIKNRIVYLNSIYSLIRKAPRAQALPYLVSESNFGFLAYKNDTAKILSDCVNFLKAGPHSLTNACASEIEAFHTIQ